MKRLILFLLIATTLRADDPQFQKANQDFVAGNFKEAAAGYEAEIKSGNFSANLFYDLGNAYFRTGDFGRAILNYERARLLEPRHPEAEANLRLAREQARTLELTQTPAERALAATSVDNLAIAAAIAFWLGVVLVVVRPRGGMLVSAIALFLICAVCTGGCFYLHRLNDGAAIVVGENVEARVATADNARTVLSLPVGSKVQILQERGEWDYARLPDNQRGWIAGKAAEKISL